MYSVPVFTLQWPIFFISIKIVFMIKRIDYPDIAIVLVSTVKSLS